MSKFKTYNQFVNESVSSQFSQSVLTALESSIMEMVENIKKWIIEEHNKKGIDYKISEFEAEMIRLNLIFDMLKSFEKYTEPTDKLITIKANSGRKGIEINATIEREGAQYPYYTEAIGAGGFNIQSFHYRYLTKTTLPSAKTKGTLANEYAERIKKMNKAEKLNFDIKNIERDIEKIDAKMTELGGITDEQIAKILKDANDYAFNMPSWEQIIKNGAAKNYNNSEQEYLAKEAEYQASKIDFWRTQNIKWPADRKKSLEKELVKLRAKLSALV
jgi:hypothetical protein